MLLLVDGFDCSLGFVGVCICCFGVYFLVLLCCRLALNCVALVAFGFRLVISLISEISCFLVEFLWVFDFLGVLIALSLCFEVVFLRVFWVLVYV